MVYYPLSKIQANLFTSGNEFAIALTQTDYKGYYFSTYDGKFFTEKTPSKNSVELIRYAPKKSKTSLGSLGYTIEEKDNPVTQHFIPKPTDQDYVQGFITRYFVKRVNGDESTVKELDQTTYDGLQDNPLYIIEEGVWYITGVVEDITLTGGMVIPGVSTNNRATISRINKTIPGVDRYLRDPLQFYK